MSIKSISYLLILILVLPFAGCSGKDSGRSAGEFIVGLEGNPSSLDPRYATDAYGVRIIPLIFNGLLKKDISGAVIPDLAASWEHPDPLTHKLTLREGLTFHNGEALSAKDVVATYLFAMDKENGCPMAGSLAKIESVEALDDLTILFKLTEPFVSFPFQLRLGILPERLASTRDIGDELIGTGPYRLASFTVGEEIVLTPFAEHFGGKPTLERVVFRILRNATTRLLEVKAGGIDLLQNAVPPYSVKFLEREEGLGVIRAPGASYQYLGFNLEDEITKDVRVRKAIAHAVNRAPLIDYVMQGQAREASSFLPPEHWAYSPDAPRYGYDPALAKELLDEAGFTDPDGDGPKMRFHLSYKTSTDKTANESARVIADQLSKVGIGVEVMSFEWGTFFSDVKKGNFQMMSLRWVGISDPDVLHYIFHSSSIPPSGANRGRYVSKEVDEWLDTSRVTFDLEERKKLYQNIQAKIAEDCVYVSLWWPDNVVVIRDGFTGFIPFPGGEYTSLAEVKKTM